MPLPRPVPDPDRIRAELVAVAAELFRAEGLGGVSFRLVAAEAGLPLATVQRAFTAKEDMLRAAFRALADGIAVEMDRTRRMLGPGPFSHSQIADLLAGFVSTSLEPGSPSAAILEIMMAVARDPSLRDTIADFLHQLAAFWGDLAGDGEFGWFVMEVQLGLAVVSAGAGQPLSNRLLTAEVVRRLLLGPGAAPGADGQWFALFLRQAAAVAPDRPRFPAGGTPDRILTAAAEIIVEQGVQELSYRGAALRAGVSLSSVTHLFPTRADLLRAAHAKIADELAAFGSEVVQAGRPADSVDFNIDVMLHTRFGHVPSALANCEMQMMALRDPDCRDLTWQMRVMTGAYHARLGDPDFDPYGAEAFRIHCTTTWASGCGLVHLCLTPREAVVPVLRQRLGYGLARIAQ